MAIFLQHKMQYFGLLHAVTILLYSQLGEINAKRKRAAEGLAL